MGVFYKENSLFLGDSQCAVDLSKIDVSKTPAFAYDLSGMERAVLLLKKALGDNAHIHFAIKSNSHRKILSHFANMGLGADVVSGGEIKIAREAGFSAKNIIFSGVGKTVQEIEYALSEGIEQINVESIQELERIAEISQRMGVKAPVAFRMNPDVDAKTHPYITTGFRENKFGMDESCIPKLIEILKMNNSNLDFKGLTIHIGSQLRDNQCFAEAIEKTIPVIAQLKAEGFQSTVFDVGGGVGIDYEQGVIDEAQVLDYGKIVQSLLADKDLQIFCEPGRLITACHGVLLGEVQYVKQTPFKDFAILNTGMHHLMRPALYQAYHRVLPVLKKHEVAKYDIVGPICESSDFFAKDREMSILKQGDVLAIAEAGAYGRSMASEYNAHSYPNEYVFYNGELV